MVEAAVGLMDCFGDQWITSHLRKKSHFLPRFFFFFSFSKMLPPSLLEKWERVHERTSKMAMISRGKKRAQSRSDLRVNECFAKSELMFFVGFCD